MFFCRPLTAYREAAWNFVNTALKELGNPKKIRCPCKNCRNHIHLSGEDVVLHLVKSGMDLTYMNDIWHFHGEPRPSATTQNASVKLSDTYRMYVDAHVNDEMIVDHTVERREGEFTQLLEDGETPLYPGCTKYTKLSATVVLFKHKAVNGITDKAFTELLQVLHDMLPQENTLPDSTYSTKKLLKTFDLGYEKIYACPNDCCLFRKELADKDNCPKCNASRWKSVIIKGEKRLKRGWQRRF